jgi:hypothetical protein
MQDIINIEIIMKRNHTFKKLYIVYLSIKATHSRNHPPTDYLRKLARLEESIGLTGWSEDPHASLRYPHYKHIPNKVIVNDTPGYRSTDLENNENKNTSLNNNSTEDNPISECAVCFEQFGSTNNAGKLITRSCIIPCGHAQFCFSCLEKVKACPICKRQIHKHLRVYI